jgi:hypothetical protein
LRLLRFVFIQDDDAFWENLNPLALADVPHLQDSVVVVGYPVGGARFLIDFPYRERSFPFSVSDHARILRARRRLHLRDQGRGVARGPAAVRVGACAACASACECGSAR